MVMELKYYFYSPLTWYTVLLSAFVFLVIRRHWYKAKIGRGGRATTRRPPGPAGWPVVGNMFDLGAMPHHNLYKLRFKYGPVIWLQLGSVNTMVIQSANAAAELFQKHDLNFSDRKVPDALTALGYNEGSLAFGKYSAYWSLIRRLSSMELLSAKRLKETAFLRRKCMDNMIRWIEEESSASRSKEGLGEVEICRFLFLMAFNVVGNMILSKDLLEPHTEEGYEFFDAMGKFMKWAGKPNVADFKPFLRSLDPLGIKRNMCRDMGRNMKIVEQFVKERIKQKRSGKHAGKDFLDTLLEYEGEGRKVSDQLSERNITILILEMFFAGSETTSSTIEWAMSELLRNPDSMRKAKEELDRVIGRNQTVEETDIENLPYLRAVMKETLRLHPAVPLLVPRNSMEDTNYMGYDIPKNTQVFVNVWAIGRDPESWKDPLAFAPERFLGKNIEYIGKHYELIPFGVGRRMCVGYALGHRLVHVAVANLLQWYDWELSSLVTPETMDMDERMGMTLRKLVPLRAIPRKRSAVE